MTIRREWLERDFYGMLGVDRTVNAKDLKKAYRTLAHKHHPDNNPDDSAAESRFKDISEAYDVLSDPKTRKEYDEARDAFARGAYMGGPPGGGTQYVRVEDLGDIGDLFGSGGFGGLGDLFGGGRRARGPQPGADLQTEVSLSFHEAIDGVTRTLTVDGRDQVQVKIPAGVNDGARIRLRGKGRPGTNGGSPGDLFVSVHTARHPVFSRSGKDLKMRAGDDHGGRARRRHHGAHPHRNGDIEGAAGNPIRNHAARLGQGHHHRQGDRRPPRHHRREGAGAARR